jgi:hypothetical protein
VFREAFADFIRQSIAELPAVGKGKNTSSVYVLSAANVFRDFSHLNEVGRIEFFRMLSKVSTGRHLVALASEMDPVEWEKLGKVMLPGMWESTATFPPNPTNELSPSSPLSTVPPQPLFDLTGIPLADLAEGTRFTELVKFRFPEQSPNDPPK